jgi:hypothetical protein
MWQADKGKRSSVRNTDFLHPFATFKQVSSESFSKFVNRLQCVTRTMSSTERQEGAKQQVAPKVGEKEKPKLNDYKSQEEFRKMVIGTGTPAEEREEERAK